MIEKLTTATIGSPDALPKIRLLVVAGALALGMVSNAATPTPAYALDEYLLDINNDG